MVPLSNKSQKQVIKYGTPEATLAKQEWAEAVH